MSQVFLKDGFLYDHFFVYLLIVHKQLQQSSIYQFILQKYPYRILMIVLKQI